LSLEWNRRKGYVPVSDELGRTLGDYPYTPPPAPYSYLIFKNAGIVYARNGKTGELEFSDPDAAVVMQASINAIKSLVYGGKLFIKGGEYELTSKLDITNVEYITIEGEGWAWVSPDGSEGAGTTKLKFINDTDGIFGWNTVLKRGVCLKNLYIQGKGKDVSTKSGLALKRFDQIQLVQISVVGFNIGMYLLGQDAPHLRNSSMLFNQTGLRLESSIYSKVTDCEISDNSTEQLTILNGRDNRIRGVTLKTPIGASAYSITNDPRTTIKQSVAIVNNVQKLFENSGTATFTGDGTTTVFNIAHGLVSTPTFYSATPLTLAARADHLLSADATNIIVTFDVAPALGASIQFSWKAEV